MTTDGYKEAIQYLKETDNMDLLAFEKSLDGYTVVQLANSIYEEAQKLKRKL